MKKSSHAPLKFVAALFLMAIGMGACGPLLLHHWSLYYPVVIEAEVDSERVGWDFDARCDYRGPSDIGSSPFRGGVELLRPAWIRGASLRRGGALFMAIPDMCNRPFEAIGQYAPGKRPSLRTVVEGGLKSPPDYIPFIWWYDKLPDWSQSEAFVTGDAYQNGRVKLLRIRVGPLSLSSRRGAMVADSIRNSVAPQDPLNHAGLAWRTQAGLPIRISGRSKELANEFGQMKAGCGWALMPMRVPDAAVQRQVQTAMWLTSGAPKTGVAIVPDTVRFEWLSARNEASVGSLIFSPFNLDAGWFANAATLNPMMGYGVLPQRHPDFGSPSARASDFGMLADRPFGQSMTGTDISAHGLPLLAGTVATECSDDSCTVLFDRPGTLSIQPTNACRPPDKLSVNWRGKEILRARSPAEITAAQVYDAQTHSIWVFRYALPGAQFKSPISPI